MSIGNIQYHIGIIFQSGSSQIMAFSFRAGTNRYHDFPKLARESGFYFNMYRTRANVDWNIISTIDIDRVIRERDFITIDDNINSVINYHLKTEYDMKILDPNFMKLFRLAQLSVEYLLYCKQYLDHSVIILKDELRLKLVENAKLKQELLTSENNIRELREKFRAKYKLIEKKFNDSHGEIYKCPFCPKTFIADIFVNSHVARRHSNTSQLSLLAPIHEQYRAEAEKLHHEIKTLKERLNETERVIRSETIEHSENIDSSKYKYDNIKIEQFEDCHDTTYKKLVKEHEKYRNEMNHLTTMLFNEIRSLKQDEKKFINQNELANDNVKELLKQQENQIQRLHDQLQQLSTTKSISNIEIIQAQLNAQKNYWQTNIKRIESKHRNDIETLYEQFKITQASADFIEAGYRNKIEELERSQSDQVKSLDNLQLSIGQINKRSSNHSPNTNDPQNQIEIINEKIDENNVSNSEMNPSNNTDIIIIEDTDKISDAIIIPTTSVNQFHCTVTSTMNSNENSAGIYIESDSESKNIHILESPNNNLKKSSIRKKKTYYERPDINIRTATNKNNTKQRIHSPNHKICVTNLMVVSSSESDESSSQTASVFESKTSKSHQGNQTNSIGNGKLKMEIQEALEQKLRDLGIDPEWEQIPNVTYRQLLYTVKYHRSINSKKYIKFKNIRYKIVRQLAHKQKNIDENINNNDTERQWPISKLTVNGRLKASKCLSTSDCCNLRTPKWKSTTKKFINKHLPKNISKIKSPIMQPKLSQTLQINHDECDIISSNLIKSIDVKHFSHCYESIEDQIKDKNHHDQNVNPSRNISALITTLTPQCDYIDVLSKQKQIIEKISSQNSNSTRSVNSPKYNKSVLKSAAGSTGSLVKKKVLFDLQSIESNTDKSNESQDLFENPKEKIDNNESGSAFKICNTLEVQSSELQKNQPKNTGNIILRTSQSKKIAEISRKIETQLSSIRHNNHLSGIDSIFTKLYHMESDELFKGQLKNESMDAFENNKLNINTPVNQLPPSISENQQFTIGSASTNYKFDIINTNLDSVDIE